MIHIWDFPTAAAAAPDRRFSWASMSSCSDPNAEVFRRFTWATLFICSIVAVCMTMPDLFLALGLEQLFGIMLDFALPMMFISQVAAGGEKREIFWMPAAAHAVHLLATILPLVFRYVTTERFLFASSTLFDSHASAASSSADMSVGLSTFTWRS